MADSVVDKKSNSAEDDQLPCSTSSLSPVNNVLTATSNLHFKSKLLLQDESSVQQIEHMEGVDHESPVQQNMESVAHESPVQQDMETVEHKSPVQQIVHMEGVDHESPVQQNMESVEHESPVQQNMESVEHESPVQQNMESVEHESPVQQNMESVEHESSTLSDEKKKDFEIGDIVWAKLGSYPFWPSMVCTDPETNVYIKGSLENKKQFSLHVRFCNDHGRRSWAKTIEVYSGKEEFLSKYPNGLAFLKNSKKQMEAWDGAVREADTWLRINNRDDRWVRFSLTNGLTRSKISGLGPKPTNTFKTPNTFRTPNTLKTPKAPTPSTSAGKSYTVQEFLDLQKALKISCRPSTSGSQGITCQASTSGSNINSCYAQLKEAKKKTLEEPKLEDGHIILSLPKLELSIPEIFKPKPAKRKYVDVKQKAIREELKKKKAKRALQVKKYGFSYSSSEYESTDDEAEPLVPFNPNRKVLESIKYAVLNLESEGMQREREKRLLIKAIRLAERRKSKKNKEEEEEEEQEQ